ncbi:MAG: hypothetical protein AAGG72_01255 [Pseudomonadota bacterium]
MNLLTATVALTAAIMLPVVGAQAQSSCKWYGATALKQQKQNEKLDCKFSGPEWHSNLADHMTWCANRAPDFWKASARERDRMLAKCAKR